MQTEELKKYSEEHLLYEIEMLFYTAREWKSYDGLLRSALIESFLVHFRCLVEFFQPKSKRHKDDVWAKYYTSQDIWQVLNKEKKDKLTQWCKKAEKLGLHQTKRRIEEEQKEWNPVEMTNTLLPLLVEFEKQVPQGNLCQDFQSEMERLSLKYGFKC